MPHSIEGLFEINEVVEQVSLMLDVFLNDDTADEYIYMTLCQKLVIGLHCIFDGPVHGFPGRYQLGKKRSFT